MWQGHGDAGNCPADGVYEGMFLDACVPEVDAIHRRIVLSVVNIPTEQPPRPETPSKIHPEDGDVIDVPMDIPANE